MADSLILGLTEGEQRPCLREELFKGVYRTATQGPKPCRVHQAHPQGVSGLLGDAQAADATRRRGPG